MIAATILAWIGWIIGVAAILACALIVAAFLYDAHIRRKARYARGYELPDPQARPAPHFTRKPPLSVTKSQLLTPNS